MRAREMSTRFSGLQLCVFRSTSQRRQELAQRKARKEEREMEEQANLSVRPTTYEITLKNAFTLDVGTAIGSEPFTAVMVPQDVGMGWNPILPLDSQTNKEKKT
jgi:hypothetical protein